MKYTMIFLMCAALINISVPGNCETQSNPQCLIRTSMGDIQVELLADAAPKTVRNFIDLAEGRREFKDPKSGEMVKRPFYDNLIFHRVIKNFMIQGGCPKGDGTGGPGYKFEDEINADSLGLNTVKAITPDGRPNPRLGLRSKQGFLRMVIQPLSKKMGINSQEDFQKKEAEFNKTLKALTLKDCFELAGYRYRTDIKSLPPKRGVLAMANAGPNTNGSQFFINLVDTPWLTGKHTVFGRVVKGMDVVDKIGNVPVDERSRPKSDVTILSIRQIASSPDTSQAKTK